jgi:Leucine-rich repeat (LRR) protein
MYSRAFGQMTKQETRLILSGQHLKRIPDGVFKNTKLTYLDLGSSDVSFYPPLSRLLEIDSNANHITKLSDKIGNLTNLRTLILNSNNLRILPGTISRLTNLEVLDLSINRNLDILKEVEKIEQLPNLKVLKIVDVKLINEDVDRLRKSLRPDIKIVLTIPEYIESLK